MLLNPSAVLLHRAPTLLLDTPSKALQKLPRWLLMCVGDVPCLWHFSARNHICMHHSQVLSRAPQGISALHH